MKKESESKKPLNEKTTGLWSDEIDLLEKIEKLQKAFKSNPEQFKVMLITAGIEVIERIDAIAKEELRKFLNGILSDV
jgi:hypothetical protein